jgi:hypothetical protein
MTEKNDTIFNIFQQNEKNLRNFRTSFDDVLIQNKHAVADLYSSVRHNLDREVRHKKVKAKRKFLDMKKKHYSLLRQTLHTLLGFREVQKTLALFFKLKLENPFGIVELLRKLDSLFIKKLTVSVHPGPFSSQLLSLMRNLPNMRMARKRLRRNPISSKFQRFK